MSCIDMPLNCVRKFQEIMPKCLKICQNQNLLPPSPSFKIWVFTFKFYNTYLCILIQDWLTIKVNSSQDTFELNPSTMSPNQ
jgi:hypothetical protein